MMLLLALQLAAVLDVAVRLHYGLHRGRLKSALIAIASELLLYGARKLQQPQTRLLVLAAQQFLIQSRSSALAGLL